MLGLFFILAFEFFFFFVLFESDVQPICLQTIVQVNKHAKGVSSRVMLLADSLSKSAQEPRSCGALNRCRKVLCRETLEISML